MNKDLRIIFMGTPEFAVASLKKLITAKYNIVAVVTAPDKPAGRGQKIGISAVKACALTHNLPVLQPTNLKSSEFLAELKSYNANLQIVVAFRMLPEAVWAMPEIGTFNLHASLLPQYRGAAPIHWAIINGETETGVTTFFLQHQIDTGDMIDCVKVPISEEDTAGTLHDRLMNIGADLVLTTVEKISTGNYTTTPQQTASDIKTAPKIFKETCQIDLSKNTREIINFIRGLSPYPTAWVLIKGKVYKIYSAKAITTTLQEDIATDNKTFLYLKTSDGAIAIEELQAEGKKRMLITDFLRGNRI
jgi:methionyl-tRNA formyltransferase